MSLNKLTIFKHLPGLLIVLVCFSSISYCHGQQDIKIGLLAPLTGENKSIGQSISAAVSAAIPEANNYLKPAGIQVVLVEKDTAGKPEAALLALKELDADGVRIVVGPCLSSAAKHCLSYANRKEIILISPSSTSVMLNKKDCLFRMMPPDSKQGAALAKYVTSVNIKEVLPVYLNNPYGKSLHSAFDKAFKEQAGKMLKGVAFKPEELTDELLVEKITKAVSGFADHEKAAVLFIGYGELNTFFGNVAKDADLTQYRWFTSEALLAGSPNFLEHEELADFAHKTKLATVSIHPESLITDLYSLHICMQTKAQLPQGESLNHFAYPAWNALWIAVEAIRRNAAGDAASLKQAVTALGCGSAFYGMDLLRWDKNGDSSNGTYYMLEANADNSHWQTKAICRINSNWAEPELKTIAGVIWPPGRTATSLTLHGLVPLSGGLNLTSVKDGFELAIQHINDYFNTANIKTVISGEIHDTQTNPDVALGIASSLHQSQAVPLFVGPCVSSVVEDVAAGLPAVCLVSPTSTALELAKADDYVARLCPTDAAQTKALSTLITMDGVDRVVIIYRDDIWGQGIKTAFTNCFNGDTRAFAYNIDNTDFRDMIAEIEDYMEDTLALKKAIVLVSFDEAATIFEQIDEQSHLLDYSWYGTDGTANIAVMLAEGPGEKAVQTGLQCSTYSPYIVDMFSPRLLLFNQWINGSVHQVADPNTVLAYDSTWLAAFAAMLNSAEATPGPAEIWAKLTEKADLLTGYSYADALDTNGDRLSKYYSFYQLVKNSDGLAWHAVNSFMEANDKSKSLKRAGSLMDKCGSKLSIHYKRNNTYDNGVPVAEKKCDKVKADNLPLGSFQIPENLILDSGVMTGSLSVFVDGNYFPCVINRGDWKIAEDLSSYVFTNSKEKMNSDYFPMTLNINHAESVWSFCTSKLLLEKLDWSDGIEFRIDLNRQPVVILTYRPDIQLKLSFNREDNGLDYSPAVLNSTITQLDISQMTACYSSKNPWKGKFIINQSNLTTTDLFNPVVSGVSLKANDNTWTVAAGNNWGKQADQGIFRHSSLTNSSKTQWLFDSISGKWQFHAKGINTIGIANTVVDEKGILVELYIDENNKSTLLLKPKINAVLHWRE